MEQLVAFAWAFLDALWRAVLAVLIVWGVLRAWWEGHLKWGRWGR